VNQIFLSESNIFIPLNIPATPSAFQIFFNVPNIPKFLPSCSYLQLIPVLLIGIVYLEDNL
jgi:hypothetical protein